MPSPNRSITAKEFNSTSPQEIPTILHVSFAKNPAAPLGAKLLPCDKPTHMFVPGYAVIDKVFDEGVAFQAGVLPGDILVAVNGVGYRRFAPDYEHEEVLEMHPDVKVLQDHRVVTPEEVADDYEDQVEGARKIYDTLLDDIKVQKGKSTADTPLVLTLERYTWDARPHAWARFLTAREGNIPDAMTMWQNHQNWKLEMFPIRLTKPGLQRILRQKAVSEIRVEHAELPGTVYVNYGRLLKMLYASEITAEDIVLAFVLFTERMLSRAANPRTAKTSQFIDLTSVSYASGFRADVLKVIYNVFEPNYPETLHRMVMYPSSTVFVSAMKDSLITNSTCCDCHLLVLIAHSCTFTVFFTGNLGLGHARFCQSPNTAQVCHYG